MTSSGVLSQWKSVPFIYSMSVAVKNPFVLHLLLSLGRHLLSRIDQLLLNYTSGSVECFLALMKWLAPHWYRAWRTLAPDQRLLLENYQKEERLLFPDGWWGKEDIIMSQSYDESDLMPVIWLSKSLTRAVKILLFFWLHLCYTPSRHNLMQPGHTRSNAVFDVRPGPQDVGKAFNTGH